MINIMIGEILSGFLSKINLDEVYNKIKEELSSSGLEQTAENIKILWNYSEKNTKEYSFNELLSWAKDNIPSNVKKVCVFKESALDKYIKLHICYLDEDDNPVLNGDFPHQVVNALTLDEDLTEKFGNKNMLVLG